MTTNVINLNDNKVQYHHWCTDIQLPYIVDLHGLGGSGLNIIEMADELSEFKIISIDLPGHGNSDPLQSEFNIENVITWLNSVIEY